MVAIVNDILEVAKAELAALRAENPSHFFIPNIGQERLLNEFRGPHYPFIGVIGAGNGLGKTALMANVMVGCAYGPDEVSEWMEQYGLWQREADWRAREGKPSMYRIVCHADSMKEGGPVLQAIREWFPKGRYKLFQKGKTYYSQMECYDEDGNVCAIFDVKTHDQEKTAHAGTNLNGIFFDEPPPEHVYGESVGRVRKEGAFILFFLTPLEVAGWMVDQIIDDADPPDAFKKEIVVVHGSIWDNCRDIPGTRGHLARETIDRQIREWSKLSASELEARTNGTFTHLSGALYKVFNPQVHVIDDFPIPPWWPIYRIMDPHDTKAPAIAWFTQSEHEAFLFREWPEDNYVKLGENQMTISQLVNYAKTDIERPWRNQILWSFMDPNKGKTTYANTKRTVQEEYSLAGWDFELSEDDLQVGHQRVQTLLHYNEKMPVSATNRPYLRVFRSCENSIVALQRYGIKKGDDPGKSLTSRVDKKYKDFADVVRYFAMRLQPYKRVEEFTQFYNTLIAGRVKK